jgi:hypothetical protein
VNSTVRHVVSHNTTALETVHDQVKSKVLDEEDAVVAKGSTEQSMKHAMAGPIGNCAAPVGLTALSEVLRLATERTLVDLAVLGAREGHAVRFELEDGLWGFAGHVLNGILVTEPVGSLDRIVEVPPPVIIVHIAESRIDSALSGDSVTPGGEQLGDASGLEASLGESEGGAQTSTARADNNSVVLVINDCVVANRALAA